MPPHLRQIPVQGGTDTQDQEQAKDLKFLLSRKTEEDLHPDADPLIYVHAPRWPMARKAGWWVILGDEKTGRTIIPPIKITGVTLQQRVSTEELSVLEMVFIAPSSWGTFLWKLWIISDTFVDEEIYDGHDGKVL